MNAAPIRPSHGAAQVVVLKNVVGNDVLDLRRTRQRIHREAECAERDRAGDQPLRDIALAEHLGGERIDREHHDEQRHAAVGQDRADHDDREDCALAAEHADHRRDDRLGESRRAR